MGSKHFQSSPKSRHTHTLNMPYKFVVTALLLSKHALAGFNEMEAMFESYAKSKNISAAAGQYRTSGLGDDRNFVGIMATFFEPINGYGCWCYFGDEYVRAGGPAQDAVDLRCKQLIQGYRCAMLDSRERGDGDCKASTVEYTPYNFFSSIVALEEDCNTNNQDQCQIDACIIEGSFTLDFFAQFPNIVHDDQFDEELGFDHTGICTQSQNREGKDHRECCGEIPARFPFNSENNHVCCNGQLESI